MSELARVRFICRLVYPGIMASVVWFGDDGKVCCEIAPAAAKRWLAKNPP